MLTVPQKRERDRGEGRERETGSFSWVGGEILKNEKGIRKEGEGRIK
jgi:hypothetical protein